MFSRVLCAGLIASAALTATVQPAKAWGGGAFVAGTALGLTTGVLLTRPYAYPYAYAPYPYPYAYYPAPVYAAPPTPVPYAYGYPPGYVAAAPAPAPYAAAQAAPAPTPACGGGRFFNTLTGTCDR